MNQIKKPNYSYTYSCVESYKGQRLDVVFRCVGDGERTRSSEYFMSKLNRLRSDVIRGGYNDRDVNYTTPHICNFFIMRLTKNITADDNDAPRRDRCRCPRITRRRVSGSRRWRWMAAVYHRHIAKRFVYGVVALDFPPTDQAAAAVLLQLRTSTAHRSRSNGRQRPQHSTRPDGHRVKSLRPRTPFKRRSEREQVRTRARAYDY